MNVNRELAGKSTGGQFAKKVNGELATDLNDDALIEGEDHSEIPYDASADEIRTLAKSPDHFIRAQLSGFKNVPEDVLEELQQPEQELGTRQSVIATMYPGVAARAAHDPHPLIRAHALFAGWDLSADEKHRLQKDRGVEKVMRLLTA
jgi:hypothetical protein